eukprot:606029-Pelagomonas_calceolata.AAC.1
MRGRQDIGWNGGVSWVSVVMVAGSTLGTCSFTGWLIHGGSHKSGYYFLCKGADSSCGWHINGL